jgi:hypothetical protein
MHQGALPDFDAERNVTFDDPTVAAGSDVGSTTLQRIQTGGSEGLPGALFLRRQYEVLLAADLVRLVLHKNRISADSNFFPLSIQPISARKRQAGEIRPDYSRLPTGSLMARRVDWRQESGRGRMTIVHGSRKDADPWRGGAQCLR